MQLLGGIGIIVMAITALQYFSTEYRPRTITYSEFQEYIKYSGIENKHTYGMRDIAVSAIRLITTLQVAFIA